MENENTFRQWKKQCLNRIDLSKKGSVDDDILNVVSLINNCDNYFTTSSCSGRIILIDGVSGSPDVQKQNLSWIFVTHNKCQKSHVISGLERAAGDSVFKFEPFVLHVQCRQLEDAQLLHSVAINSGFRNSGLTVGKKGKIIMAVRCTHGLEVPLSRKGLLLVNEDYIDFLVEVANQKMMENLKRIERFYGHLQASLLPAELAHCSRHEEATEKCVYKRRRRRGQEDSDPDFSRTITGLVPPELEDGLDLGLGLWTE